MSRYRDSGTMSFISTNDLSATTNIGLIVKASAATTGSMVLSAASTDKHLGTLIDHPKAGATGNVRLRNGHGTMSVQAGGTIAIGDAVTANASGQGITTVTAGDQLIGYAIEAGVTGQIIEVLCTIAKF